MGFVDLAHQVIGLLGWRRGGTGNAYGWSAGVAEPWPNRSETDPLPIGTLVRLHGGRVEPTDTDAETGVLGVVVGHYAGSRSDTFVEEDCPVAGVAAVLTKGRTYALIASDVGQGDYAFADATDGQARGDATLDAGAFGVWLTPATTAISSIAPIELFGSTVTGTGGGGGGGSPLTTKGDLFGYDTADARIPVGTSDGQVLTVDSSDAQGVIWAPVTRAIVVTINAPTGSQQFDFRVPWAGTLVRWTLLGDASGSIVVDIWKDTYANAPPTVLDTITASAKPTLSGVAKNTDATLSGWTKTFAAGDCFRGNVDSASGLTRATLILEVTTP